MGKHAGGEFGDGCYLTINSQMTRGLLLTDGR